MITEYLNMEEMRQGFTHRFRIKPEDLTETAVTTAQTISLYTLGAAEVLRNAANVVKVELEDQSDAAFNSVTAALQDSGGSGNLIAAHETNANGTVVPHAITDGTPTLYTGADAIDLVLTPTTGKALANIDKGEIVVLAEISNLDKAAL